jgi:hypothetical protein
MLSLSPPQDYNAVSILLLIDIFIIIIIVIIIPRVKLSN